MIVDARQSGLFNSPNLNSIKLIFMQAIHVSLYTLIFLIAMALVFDFMNGFHDAANAIATVVSTGVLKPHTAVAMTALLSIIMWFSVR